MNTIQKRVRHRSRAEHLVAKLRQVAVDVVEDFNNQCLQQGEPEYRMIGFAADLYTDLHGVMDSILPTVFQMLGIPTDPRPGLTRGHLNWMIKRRGIRAARRRGILHLPAHCTLRLDEKLNAACHRAWLEEKVA